MENMTRSTQRKASAWLKPAAFTVVEVLFAIAIILVGLIGIAAMVPFAARQANESYRIAQAIALGESALATEESLSIMKPSDAQPWQLVNDVDATVGDSNMSVFSSLESLYNNRGGYSLLYYQYMNIPDYEMLYQDPTLRSHAWINMNRAIGTCFYMDPTFWGNQITPTMELHDSFPPFRRARFPYYSEQYKPSLPANAAFRTPRLTRVSLRDVNLPFNTPNMGWIKAPAARNVASVSTSDVKSLTASSSSNNIMRDFTARTDPQIVPTRGFAAITSAPPNLYPSWALMICPSETTPIIPISQVPLLSTDYRQEAIPQIPEHYDISLVVYGKRNAGQTTRGMSDSLSSSILPESERLAQVEWDPTTNEPQINGIFEVSLRAGVRMKGDIRVGDWIMLSRNVLHWDVAMNGVFVMRQKHGWYRVVSPPSSESFLPAAVGDTEGTIKVRLSGVPWDWTENEVKSAARFAIQANIPIPTGNSLMTFPATQTVATIVPDIVHVYQRSFSAN